MTSATVRVLINPDLLHYISAFYKIGKCTTHKHCEVNKRYKQNKCKYHSVCVPKQWGDFIHGDSAACAGYLNVIKQFNDQLLFSEEAIDNAAKKGHVEVLKWLHENRSEGCSELAMNRAANLTILQFLHENRTEGCTEEAMGNAAFNGDLDMVKWLHQHRTEGCTNNAMDQSSEHLEVIKWLHYNRTEGCTEWAMDNAADFGNFETLKWLHENRTEGCTPGIFYLVLQQSYQDPEFQLIKWMHENVKNCQDLSLLLTEAVFNSRFKDPQTTINLVKWIHKQNPTISLQRYNTMH